MKNRIKRFLAFALSICAIFSVFVFSGAAEGQQTRAEGRAGEDFATYDRLARVELGLLPVGSKNVNAYSRVNVRYSGKLVSQSALLINGRVYLPLRAFANSIGAAVSYDSASRTSTMRYGSLTVTVNDGAYVTYANSRPIFSFSNSVIMNDGLLYVPIETLAKTVGLSVERTSGGVSLSGAIRPMSAKAPYSEDEVFWLARIIQAESSGESLLGKIGVGNVVMNRVKSPLYPNTIYSVIFDRKYGVQFSPILNGTIYNTPNYQSRLAAMICLEGFVLSEDALFFLEPRISTSSWIPNNREYLFSILHHDFYA